VAVIGKSDQIVDYIRSRIISGRWVAGSRIPGEFELQSEFKVSRSTVRDALIRLASDGIIVRKHGSGTFVADKVFNKSGSHIIITADAARLSSYTGYWHRKLVDEAQAQISKAGYKAVLVVGNGVSEEEFLSSTNLSNDVLDPETVGAIDLSSRGCIQNYLQSTGIHFVKVEGAINTSQYSVVIDYVKMVEIAVNALEGHGYEDFAVMCYAFSDYDNPFQSEYTRLARAAVKGREDRIIAVPDAESVLPSDAFKEWWSSNGRPDAMFFMDDNLFDVASRTILELGIKVPEELAVLPLTNVGKSIYFPTPLSHLEFDPVIPITQAWQMLYKLVNSEPVIRAVVNVPPSYIEGDSLGNWKETSITSNKRRENFEDTQY